MVKRTFTYSAAILMVLAFSIHSLAQNGVIANVSPADKAVTYDEDASFRGTVSDPKVEKLLLNNERVEIQPDRAFSSDVQLKLGKNTINIVALDKRGRVLELMTIRLLRLAYFPDIGTDSFAAEPIIELATLGIFEGYPDGIFKSGDSVTRAQMAKMLVNLKGIPLSKGSEAPFNDIDENNWAYEYIVAAAKSGIVSGYPFGRFKPDNELNRVEGLSMMVRFELNGSSQSMPSQNITFRDLSRQHFGAKSVALAKDLGFLDYIQGDYLGANELFTRGEAAWIMARTKYGKKKIEELLNFDQGY